jgi:hypothetical protein
MQPPMPWHRPRRSVTVPEAPEAPPVAELEAEAPEAPEAPPVAVRPMGHGVPVMGEGGVTWRA